MQWLADAFTKFFQKISAVLTWFGELFVAVFVALWDMLKDGFCWMLEELFDIAAETVEGVNVGAISDHMSVWGSIPGNVLEVLAALGMGTAMAIVVAAIGIRLVLQLIPFVRLGS